jgi:hypothetical protein
MQSPKEFTARAIRIQKEAIAVRESRCGNKAELNVWMSFAKRQGMTWVVCLYSGKSCRKDNTDAEVFGVALDFDAEGFWGGRYFVRHCEVYGAACEKSQPFSRKSARNLD